MGIHVIFDGELLRGSSVESEQDSIKKSNALAVEALKVLYLGHANVMHELEYSS